MSNVDVDRFEEAVAYGECFQVRVDGLSMLPLLGYGRDTLIVRRIGLNQHCDHAIFHLYSAVCDIVFGCYAAHHDAAYYRLVESYAAYN